MTPAIAARASPRRERSSRAAPAPTRRATAAAARDAPTAARRRRARDAGAARRRRAAADRSRSRPRRGRDPNSSRDTNNAETSTPCPPTRTRGSTPDRRPAPARPFVVAVVALLLVRDGRLVIGAHEVAERDHLDVDALLAERDQGGVEVVELVRVGADVEHVTHAERGELLCRRQLDEIAIVELAIGVAVVREPIGVEHEQRRRIGAAHRRRRLEHRQVEERRGQRLVRRHDAERMRPIAEGEHRRELDRRAPPRPRWRAAPARRR